MPSRLKTLRAAVAAAINARTYRDAEGNTQNYVYDNFTIHETYLPKAELIHLATGKLYVVGMSHSEERNARCGFLEEIPIQVGFQIAFEDKLDPNDALEFLDKLTELIEQIKASVRQGTYDTAVGYYTWLRTLPLTDPNGQPVHFASLEQGVYQTYFTSYFKTLQSS